MTHTAPRIGIVVVAYNAERKLLATLDRIPEEFRARLDEVIVLDDASDDDTIAKAREWAERVSDHTAVVVRHTKNLGYGGNQKAAYRMAAERGLDIVVLLHGDGQYAPELLPQMVEPIIAGEADAVFGSRMMTPKAAKAGGMPAYKRLGNRVLTGFENRMLGTSLSEFHSGYRAYRVAALQELPIQNNTDDFDFDTQIIIQLVDAGKTIVEIPIPTYYGDEICYVNGMRYARDVAKDVVEYRLSKAGFGTSRWVTPQPDYALKMCDGSSHRQILEILDVGEPLSILDLGCGPGELGARAAKLGHRVTGVDATESEGVRDRLEAFYLADLSQGIPDEVGTGYDVVVLADVIEHVADPEALLRAARARLRPGGRVVLSVPNAAHWYPRARMATGLFGYDQRGILDETHLRFFTRRTLRHLVARAGFDILAEDVTGIPFGGGEAEEATAFTRVNRALAKARPQLFAYQFVMQLTPHVAQEVVDVYEPAERP